MSGNILLTYGSLSVSASSTSLASLDVYASTALSDSIIVGRIPATGVAAGNLMLLQTAGATMFQVCARVYFACLL